MKRTVMTVLFLVGISTYAQEVQKDSVVTTPKVETRTVIKVVPASTQTVEPSEDDFKKVRLSINGGYGYRTAPVEGGYESFENHIKGLKSGFDWHVDFHYFIEEKFGIGIKYNSLSSSNSSIKVKIPPQGILIDGLKNKISINYVGPSVMYREPSPNLKHAFILTGSIGYISIKNIESLWFDSYLINTETRGSSLGVSFDIGYDFGLSENVSFGILGSLTTGVVNEVEVTYEDIIRKVDLKELNGEGEGLGRVSISAGFRFNI